MIKRSLFRANDSTHEFMIIIDLFLLQVFERDGLDYFVDMMPALHNYVTVDTATFLTLGHTEQTPRPFPQMVFNMCKKMLLGMVSNKMLIKQFSVTSILIINLIIQFDIF